MGEPSAAYCQYGFGALLRDGFPRRACAPFTSRPLSLRGGDAYSFPSLNITEFYHSHNPFVKRSDAFCAEKIFSLRKRENPRGGNLVLKTRSSGLHTHKYEVSDEVNCKKALKIP